MISGKLFFRFFACILTLCLAASFAGMPVASAAGGIELSTSYPGVTVKAGESVSFSLRVDNESAEPQNVALSVQSIPEGWEGYFEGMGKPVSRVYVKKEDYASVTFNIKMPADVKEGDYKIVLVAQGSGLASDTLELELKASEKEIAKGKLTAQYPELQGPNSASFKFSIDIANNSANDQSYSLSAQAESGWQVSFTPSYEDNQIASLSLQAGKNQGIDVQIQPPKTAKAGKYTIPVAAVSAEETLAAELSVIITGTYELQLSTPTGRLNADAYAGRETPVTLVLTNAGSADLKDVKLTSTVPTDWVVRYDPNELEKLAAGETKEVAAYIKPGNNVIAGDYVAALRASTTETDSQCEFRVTVKTPTAWGIVGVVIILLLIGGLYWMFRKFGRR